MKILILCTIIFNLIIYGLQLIAWKKDCKNIGKDNLAVPLPDRLRATFLFITLPCIVGLLTR